MAGLGQRFVNSGFGVGKPLIPVAGVPMYAWAVESLPLEAARSLVFVTLASMPGHDALCADIAERYARYSARIVTLPHPTGGQSETVLRGLEGVATDGPLLIHNADTAFATGHDWLHAWCDLEVDGGWLVFESSHPRWSFIRLDPSGRADRVTEKDPISTLASTGTYFFRSGTAFVGLAEAGVREARSARRESYVAPLFQSIIDAGGTVVAERVKEHFCFGTPEDLAEGAPALTRFLARSV